MAYAVFDLLGRSRLVRAIGQLQFYLRRMKMEQLGPGGGQRTTGEVAESESGDCLFDIDRFENEAYTRSMETAKGNSLFAPVISNSKELLPAN